MTTLPAPNGDLTLGHLLDAAGVDPGKTLLLRHTYTVGGLESAADLAPSVLMAYVRRQEHRNKVGRRPPPLWLNFVADGQLRARFLGAYENHGEVDSEATDEFRYFDLRPSPVMSRLQNRLVIEWLKDTVNWAKVAERAASLPVVEIADPTVEQFPGFDRVLISHSQLEAVVHDSRCAPWRVALATDPFGYSCRQWTGAARTRHSPFLLHERRPQVAHWRNDGTAGDGRGSDSALVPGTGPGPRQSRVLAGQE